LRLEATEDLAKDNLPRWRAHVSSKNGVWSLACSPASRESRTSGAISFRADMLRTPVGLASSKQ
jgi:hypothetical protein